MRTAEFLDRTLFVTNLIRLFLFRRLLTWKKCNVSRTPLQIYRHLKKKRIHREWATKKKWRKRRGLSMLDIYRAHHQQVRERFKKEMARQLMGQLDAIMVGVAKMQERETGQSCEKILRWGK